jgi:hypothetical protein
VYAFTSGQVAGVPPLPFLTCIHSEPSVSSPLAAVFSTFMPGYHAELKPTVPCAIHDIAWKHSNHVRCDMEMYSFFVLPPLDTTPRWLFTSWFLPLSQLSVATVAVHPHCSLSLPLCTLAMATVAVNWPGLQPS